MHRGDVNVHVNVDLVSRVYGFLVRIVEGVLLGLFPSCSRLLGALISRINQIQIMLHEIPSFVTSPSFLNYDRCIFFEVVPSLVRRSGDIERRQQLQLRLLTHHYHVLLSHQIIDIELELDLLRFLECVARGALGP